MYLAWIDDVLRPINDMRGDPNAQDVPVADLYRSMLAAHPEWPPEQVHMWAVHLWAVLLLAGFSV